MSARIKDRAEDEIKERSIEEEDFEEAMRKAASCGPRRKPAPSRQKILPQIPEAVDDFLRNFLHRAGLRRTLNSFDAEWCSSANKLHSQSLTTTDVIVTPDAFTQKKLLQSELQAVRKERDLLRQRLLVAGESLARMQRERDFHQQQCHIVTEEKNGLVKDFKRLKKDLESNGPVMKQLDDKYQTVLRQKILLSVKKRTAQNNTKAGPKQEKSQITKGGSKKSCNNTDTSPTKSTASRKMVNSTLAQLKTPDSFSLSCSIAAHTLPITCIDLHPTKQILASASDDRSWRLWTQPANGTTVGQRLLTGEGHSDWLSSCSFHPGGLRLATTSGDTTVRLWDFFLGCCVLTLSGHSQPTWSCSFYSDGDFLASCSADRTIRLWDLNSQRCSLTLRRHTASVNSVCSLPLSNLLLTCSSDKTIALWDVRQGFCTITFHGHQHPCNHSTICHAGKVMASCDSHGIVKLWDIRKPAFALHTVDVGPHAANQVAFSPSRHILAVGSSDGVVRLLEVDSRVVSSLSGHSDAVQSVMFDHKGEAVMSAGSDGMINTWS